MVLPLSTASASKRPWLVTLSSSALFSRVHDNVDKVTNPTGSGFLFSVWTYTFRRRNSYLRKVLVMVERLRPVCRKALERTADMMLQ